MAEASSFSPLLLVVGLAFIIPFLLAQVKFVKIPIVVGEILAGILIGKSGLDLVHVDPALGFLSTFGLAYLMFLSGLEIDFKILLQSPVRQETGMRAHPLTVGSAIFILVLILSGIVSWWLYQRGMILSPYLMPLILSSSSLAVAVPILKETGALEALYGQVVLTAALISDFATMVLITLVVSLMTGGISGEILLVFLLFVALFLFYQGARRLVRFPIMEELEQATAQIGVRGALTLMLIFVALAESIGTEAILGAFLAGVVIAMLGQKESAALRRKLDVIGYGFFIPIFFIMVGADLQLSAILERRETWMIVPLLLVLLYPMQILSSIPLRMLGFGWKETAAAGILLAARLSLPIAAADVGLRLEVISPAVHAAIIVVAALSTTLSPVFYDLIMPRRFRQQKTGTLIVGASRLGLLLARRLKESHEPVTLIEYDPEHIEAARKAGIEVLLEDGRNLEGLKRAGAQGVRSLVILTGNDEINVQIAHLGKQLGIPQILTVGSPSGRTEELKQIGVQVVSPDTSTLVMLDNMLRHPRAFNLLAEQRDLEIQEIHVQNPAYFGSTLRDLKLPRGLLVLSILRNEEKIVPAGNTRLEPGDVLLMIGEPEEVQEIQSSLVGRA